jgi:hypothetical protein
MVRLAWRARLLWTSAVAAGLLTSTVMWVNSYGTSRRWGNYEANGPLIIIDSSRGRCHVRWISGCDANALAMSAGERQRVRRWAAAGNPEWKPSWFAGRCGFAIIRREYEAWPLRTGTTLLLPDQGSSQRTPGTVQPLSVPNDGTTCVRVSSWGVMVPYWSVVALMALITVVESSRIVRQGRYAHRLQCGLCPRCGYDLRATPGRCPECGQTNAAPARSRTNSRPSHDLTANASGVCPECGGPAPAPASPTPPPA